jgi:3-methyladenine DNA glycosylase AlkD
MQKVANNKTKQWFENYLKNAISYRGVKTPKVIELTKKWYKENNLSNLSVDQSFRICEELIQSPFAEDKFAGAIYIQTYLIKKVDANKILDFSYKMFKKGHFYDWSTTDWYTVRVLGPLIEKSDFNTAKKLCEWKRSKDLWQRRSSIVALRNVAFDKKYHSLISKHISGLVRQEERFIQTGIGWLISDLSKDHPSFAEEIIEKNFKFLSMEVIDRHTKYLKKHKTWKQIKRQNQKSK